MHPGGSACTILQGQGISYPAAAGQTLILSHLSNIYTGRAAVLANLA